MSNNYIPNTSAIPNILFDYWMLHLSPAEFKVLMCLARKTYGWHKDVDRISISQIAKMTGLSKGGLIRNLESLLNRGLINKVKSKTLDGDDAPNQYEINVYCLGGVPTLDGGGSLLSRQGVVTSVDKGVVYSVDTQKKTYTKENIQNNNIASVSPKIETAVAGDDLVVSSKPKKEKISTEVSDEVLELTDKMIASLKKCSPDWLTPKNINPLIEQVNLLINHDKRTPERILSVFLWVISDHFWAPKINKPNPFKYLREKFAEFAKCLDALPHQKERKFAPSSNDARGLAAMLEWEKTAL